MIEYRATCRSSRRSSRRSRLPWLRGRSKRQVLGSGRSSARAEAERALERCGRGGRGGAGGEGLPRGHGHSRATTWKMCWGSSAEDETSTTSSPGRSGKAISRRRRRQALREAFEEEHPLETLPGFDVEQGIAAFVTAFVSQADGEEALQGLIQTGAAGADEVPPSSGGGLPEQIEVQKQIRDRWPIPGSGGGRPERGTCASSAHRCLMLPVTRLLGDEGLKRPLTLDQVYVELDTKTPSKDGREERTSRGGLEAPAWREPERLSALDALAADDQVVLLGDAGSGKSTFARAVLAQLAASALDEKPSRACRALARPRAGLRRAPGAERPPPGPGARASCPGEKRTRRLAEAVQEQALADLTEEYKVEGFADGLGEAIRQGRCLLALDGLDEVPEPLRGRVREAVLAVEEHFEPGQDPGHLPRPLLRRRLHLAWVHQPRAGSLRRGEDPQLLRGLVPGPGRPGPARGREGRPRGRGPGAGRPRAGAPATWPRTPCS